VAKAHKDCIAIGGQTDGWENNKIKLIRAYTGSEDLD
jgi:hypothetical protein